MKPEGKCNIIAYLIWAFIPAWILMVLASIFFNKGNTIIYQMLLMLVMYIPFLAVILSGSHFKDLGWKIKLKGKVKYLFAAWLLPVGGSLLGTLIFYLVLPGRFDLNFSYAIESMGASNVAVLESQGISVVQLIIIQFVAAMTYAPFLNTFFALGEEVGWRGIMYPELKKRFGRTKGRIFGGVIWGIWHWPIMILAGYEYGKEYIGAPVLGPILFCVSTCTIGIICDYLYEKTDCIWIPSLAHGSINAFAGVGMLFLNIYYSKEMILGPAPIGIIAGIPFIVIAVLFCRNSIKNND